MAKKKAFNGVLYFTKDSPYYKAGEKERKLINLTEVHYNYHGVFRNSTAFESDIEGTGFTIESKWIKEFEVILN